MLMSSKPNTFKYTYLSCLMVKQQTLVLIKPDAVKRNLIGKIIGRYEQHGLKIVALKILNVDEDIVKKHYPDTMMEALGNKSARAGSEVKDVMKQGKNILRWLREFIMSHLVVAIVFEGEGAIAKVRKITGYTDPKEAEKNTIRGDLGKDSILKANSEGRPVYNLVHASGNPEEAKTEIDIWFTKEEIFRN